VLYSHDQCYRGDLRDAAVAVSTQPQLDVVRSQQYADPSTAASAGLSCDGSTEPRMMSLRMLLANATDVTGGLPGSGRAFRDDIKREASRCSSTRPSRSRVLFPAADSLFSSAQDYAGTDQCLAAMAMVC
jgi:hypothetical protein